MRLIVARCRVSYAGRLSTVLPEAVRLLMVGPDGTFMVWADGGGVKPLNWMTPPTVFEEELDASGQLERLVVRRQRGEDRLEIAISEVLSDVEHGLDTELGLEKEGVERELQELLAAAPEWCGEGLRLIRREWATDVGPVDLMCRDGEGVSVAVEIKRRGEIDGVEQLSRYLELLNRDPLLAPVRGVLAAQEIRPQARVLAEDRGIRCVILDYDALRGAPSDEMTLF